MVQNIYSSRTYVQIRRMDLVSLCGVSDLSNIMSKYSDGVWFREMIRLMTLIVMMVLMIYSHEIVYTTMLMLLGEWYVCTQDHYL
jgi:hypothetical protein